MNLINIVISLLISILIIAVFPKIFYSFLKDEKYQKNTFWKFIFSRNIAIPLIVWFIPCLFQAALDWGLGLFSGLLNFKYTPINKSEFGRLIFGFYLILSYPIFIIISSLYYSTLKTDKNSN